MNTPELEKDQVLKKAQHASSNDSAPVATAETPTPLQRMATPQDVLNRQRVLGNQSTREAIHRQTAENLTALRSDPTGIQRQLSLVQRDDKSNLDNTNYQVSQNIADDQYGWKSEYDVSFTPDDCHIKVKIKLNPQAGVSADDLKTVKSQSTTAIQKYWDKQFILADLGTQKKYWIRVTPEFVDAGESLTVSVHAGEGRDDLSNWYVKSDDTTRAHEFGHQLGLKDEYIDDTTINRKDKNAPGVHQDNSLMGNYYDEGIGSATVKVRHGESFGRDIAAVTGHNFKVTKPGFWERLIFNISRLF
jgi:hypothetical protein